MGVGTAKPTAEFEVNGCIKAGAIQLPEIGEISGKESLKKLIAQVIQELHANGELPSAPNGKSTASSDPVEVPHEQLIAQVTDSRNKMGELHAQLAAVEQAAGPTDVDKKTKLSDALKKVEDKFAETVSHLLKAGNDRIANAQVGGHAPATVLEKVKHEHNVLRDVTHGLFFSMNPAVKEVRDKLAEQIEAHKQLAARIEGEITAKTSVPATKNEATDPTDKPLAPDQKPISPVPDVRHFADPHGELAATRDRIQQLNKSIDGLRKIAGAGAEAARKSLHDQVQTEKNKADALSAHIQTLPSTEKSPVRAGPHKQLTLIRPVPEADVARGSVPADGNWHNLADSLKEFEAFLVLAWARGKHNQYINHSIAVNFDGDPSKGAITSTESYQGSYGKRIQVRWFGEEGDYALQARSRRPLVGTAINFRWTRLMNPSASNDSAKPKAKN
ncbi:MAG: HPF/RaiA family ribosome-associated protein [Bacteroidota bacterium]